MRFPALCREGSPNLFFMQLYLVYKTDVWHTYPSRVLIGAGTDIHAAIQICTESASKEGKALNSTDLYHLTTIFQTQDYTGEGEFIIDKITINKLL